MVFFEIFEDFLLFLDLAGIVLSFFISDLDFKLVVFELLLLSFDFNTQIKKLLFEAGLIMFEIGLFGLFGQKTFLDLNGCGKNFVDQFFAFLCQHFQFDLLFLLGFDLFEEVVVGLSRVYYWRGVMRWKGLLFHGIKRWLSWKDWLIWMQLIFIRTGIQI